MSHDNFVSARCFKSKALFSLLLRSICRSIFDRCQYSKTTLSIHRSLADYTSNQTNHKIFHIGILKKKVNILPRRCPVVIATYFLWL